MLEFKGHFRRNTLVSVRKVVFRWVGRAIGRGREGDFGWDSQSVALAQVSSHVGTQNQLSSQRVSLHSRFKCVDMLITKDDRGE